MNTKYLLLSLLLVCLSIVGSHCLLGISAPNVSIGTGCRCTNETIVHHRIVGVECRCTGANMVEIPTNLSCTVERLIIEEAGLRTLRANSLQPYADVLRDLTLINLEHFHYFEPGAFKNLNSLDTIILLLFQSGASRAVDDAFLRCVEIHRQRTREANYF
ncbi:Leucine-rich repeat-containing G protein-coupled receptor 1 [Carabus blaptoides fortunei]